MTKNIIRDVASHLHAVTANILRFITFALVSWVRLSELTIRVAMIICWFISFSSCLVYAMFVLLHITDEWRHHVCCTLRIELQAGQISRFRYVMLLLFFSQISCCTKFNFNNVSCIAAGAIAIESSIFASSLNKPKALKHLR